MQRTLHSQKFLLLISFILGIGLLHGQVGIGTTTPQAGSILDISSSDKGILVPRVNITNLATIAPITGGATTGLLVYNTNTTTGEGYHYWTGSVWVPLLGKDWKQSGNVSTNPASDFIGTIDNVGIRFRTNNTERLEITNNGLLRAFAPGSATTPLLAWDVDPDTGVFRNSADELNFAAGGLEFVALREGANDELVVNSTGSDINTRIETSNEANSLFVDGATDNVGLGTNSPNNSAQLEMADNNRGILINRVALTATNNAAPVVSPASGLLVYNTANSSSGSTEVLPGFYYWDGSQWVAMGGTGGRDWSLEGNAGTNPANNFIGTTDATDFVLRTDDLERFRVLGTGTAAFGNNPYTNVALRVNNPATAFGLLSETSSNGASVYGIDTGSGIGIRGENTGTGLGLYGYAANSHGAYTTTSYTGGAFLIGGIQAWGAGDNGANGVLAVSDKLSSTASNMGLRAVSGSTTSISSSSILNVGINTNATDLSLYAITEGPITSAGTIEAARFQTNYTGNAITADARDPRAQLAGYAANVTTPVGNQNVYYGGYFYSGGSSSNSSYSYAGARVGGTNYKIIGNGTVSTIVDGATPGDSKRVMFASEAPEVLFEDYGTGQLINGTATITIDPIFSTNIVVDNDHPLKVFIQLEGDCNGVYVTNKSATGFTVNELQGGVSNVPFSWHIVGNRKDEGGTAENVSKYSDLRFPNAPESIAPESLEAKEMKKYIPENNNTGGI
ncbi:autotransporter outer membrane beta-barrel domain-containing protein [Constantimarinum furrinae]|uniref:Uncharacterized protein n=1 Tax=Constantimarinum furrinae TaxID=2562285 RepID=A0A7G8PUD4_9FLAO|nr:hypothetical protein [Constantimarinum furrinae]QNJ97950.1 hypothetical protein ALE3EI_1388 [Constantimarinum furrinae]